MDQIENTRIAKKDTAKIKDSGSMTRTQWCAIRDRDPSFDGQFYYGLTTTRHVCRPSCPARTCNPKHVIIFSSVEEACAAGFTPCQRCRPDQPEWKGPRKELAAKTAAYMQEHLHDPFSLKKLAAAMFVNESYLLRTFKEITGQTPLAYCNRLKCETARQLLEKPGLSISYISDVLGYSCASHFSQVFKKICGCTPSAYRKSILQEKNDPLEHR